MENLRQKLGDPNALPPQIFNGDQYCGDFDAFFNAVENGSWVSTFFKLQSRGSSREVEP
uniref:SH3 domain-binding glutamic acid-rich-like protein 3 n=1 Tax=Callorhinchus milii TaxID=7868 RepID=A0A4W3IGN7_CALMI